MKIFLGKILFICVSSFAEYEAEGNTKEEEITKSVFIRENLSCQSNIEVSYLSIENYVFTAVLRALTEHWEIV